MPRQFKIVVEKHSDGYVAYPLGMKGTVVGEGETNEDALADLKSASVSRSRPSAMKPFLTNLR